MGYPPTATDGEVLAYTNNLVIYMSNLASIFLVLTCYIEVLDKFLAKDLDRISIKNESANGWTSQDNHMYQEHGTVWSSIGAEIYISQREVGRTVL